MTPAERNWRDAKIPQWVKDSISDELAANQITIALSWPTEAKPEPLPFQWGGYDILRGEPVAGEYWTAMVSLHGQNLSAVKIRNTQSGWKKWEFSANGRDWSTSVIRGPLFASEADARLWMLWEACELCAAYLAKMRWPT